MDVYLSDLSVKTITKIGVYSTSLPFTLIFILYCHLDTQGSEIRWGCIINEIPQGFIFVSPLLVINTSGVVIYMSGVDSDSETNINNSKFVENTETEKLIRFDQDVDVLLCNFNWLFGVVRKW